MEAWLHNEREDVLSVRSAWYRDPEIEFMCQKLIDSIPKRVSKLIELIKAKSGHVKH